MPVHQGILPREGFKLDALIKLVGRTALNPTVVLPLLLLAKYTKKGSDLAILHPTAFSRLKTLCYLSVVKWLSAWLSRGVLNNWTDDKYDWKKEIVVVTGGSGGIGGHVVQLLAEKHIKVVILDIQEPTFPTTPTVLFIKCDITSSAALAAAGEQIRARFGAEPTVLINNAGVARGKNILNATERDIRFTFEVNTLSHYWTARQFLPSMIRNNHGMVVTVASVASYIVAPDMVDYSSSKAAAMRFHEGLTAELTTRFNAPRVRTVMVNQGFTRTALFTGYQNDAPFMMPALEPETVADAIFKQVLSGKSGQIIMPAFGRTLPSLAALPHWWQNSLRAENKNIMTKFSGRQVVKDLDQFYAEKEGDERKGEESTVLVDDD